MSLTRLFVQFALLPIALLLQGCAGPGAMTAMTAAADCRGLSGAYRDSGEPTGDSLVHFLLGKPPLNGRLVQIVVSAEGLRVSSGATAGTLAAGADFNCSGAGRIALTRHESSRIHLPPLIDQIKTITYVLHADAGANLVLDTYAQTSLAPYGVQLQGPAQLESTITWRRAAP